MMNAVDAEFLGAAILDVSSLDDIFLHTYLDEVFSWMFRPWILLL